LSVVLFCHVTSWEVTLTTSSPFFPNPPILGHYQNWELKNGYWYALNCSELVEL
jgi:hypothetical protein